jgi:drug/metabolite transporter (DMT)-like permease
MDRRPLVFVIISAALFGMSTPLAKLLLKDISPVALAGFLYLGAFFGMALFYLFRKALAGKNPKPTAPLERKDAPWLFGALITGGILAPILLMSGLFLISGFSASLLLNLEGLATVSIAVLVFNEPSGKRLWLALLCMTSAGIFLAWNSDAGAFNPLGPVLIVLSMVCWGIDNNLTRNISGKDPIQISGIKSGLAGAASLSIALLLGANFTWGPSIVFALIVGAFSYGASLVFFIKSLEGMGSSRTGAFFSAAPYFGAILSLVLLREWIGWVLFPATALMIIGTWLITGETHGHKHRHAHEKHSHEHTHKDKHHEHSHPDGKDVSGPHVHVHEHLELVHTHAHWPDTHHRHRHD